MNNEKLITFMSESITNYGFPMFLIVLITIMIYKAGKWFSKEIIPLIKSIKRQLIIIIPLITNIKDNVLKLIRKIKLVHEIRRNRD